MSRRSIFSAVATWKGLSVASRQRVTGTWIADHQSTLMALSKLSATTQEKVLVELLDNGVANVADALVIIDAGRLPSHDEKRIKSLTKSIGKLDDVSLDAVLSSQADRVIYWAKRTCRI